MKKILFLYNSAGFGSLNAYANCGWIKDCSLDYDIKCWGKGFAKRTTLPSLKRTIDLFKPDYIYLTLRKKYKYWLPDLTNIKVPKIYVEVDTQKYNANDPWYRQFDKVMCRQPSFGNWKNVPLFRWSAPERSFPTKAELSTIKRKGIKFIGHCMERVYSTRKRLSKRFKKKVWFGKIKGPGYWLSLKRSSALLCPTESNYGDFIPAKLFEFLASGAAVLTNCDLKGYGTPELEKYIIRYKDLVDLHKKLLYDFTPYHNKALKVMRNHTHRVRYRELFR